MAASTSISIDRLERDRNRELRVRADFEERVSLPERAIVGHVAAGLPHEPDWSGVDRLTPAGAEKPIVHAETRVLASATRSSSQRGLNLIDAPSDFSSSWIFSGRK